jgi:2-polyprenyl-6-methoxyphenol hydroxylase-like FAD-dependent oxidoreductase
MKVLISGASIAGPVLAYWLTRNGFDVTVVERAPTLRKTGGHAVDLFRPAMEISARMGVLDRIEAHATGTTRLTIRRPPATRPAHIDYVKVIAAMSDRHVEIMRDDLGEIYYEAARDAADFRFGDQITAIADDGAVTFQHAAAERFDVIVAQTDCTPESVDWCSASRSRSASSVATWRWFRCPNPLPTRVIWSATTRQA